MRLVRKLALLCIMILSISFIGPAAHAASPYDDYYHSTDSLILTYQNCPQIDMTYTWKQYLGDSASSFASITENGSWGVSERPHFSDQNNQNAIVVYWSENSTMTANWTQYSTWVTTSASHIVHIRMESNCTIVNSYDSGAIELSHEGVASVNFFFNGNPNYPSGYEGVLVRQEPPMAKYVALGDSFSSGEGNLPFELGTDTEANTCHRSQNAYPRLLQFDSNLSLGSTAFVACSGAVSDYIINDYNQENIELPQAVALSGQTELVTISIGGNDIGFPATISTCVASGTAQGCLDALDTAGDNISDPDFLSDIKNVLTGIRSLAGTNTQVIAVGYPQLFPAYQDISGNCTWGEIPISGVVSTRTITEDEIVAMRQVHDDLNGVIQAAVVDTFDSHVHFVNPTSMFTGHEVCGGLDDWVNGVVPLVSTSDIEVASFHPNIDGQAAYASIIKTKINSF